MSKCVEKMGAKCDKEERFSFAPAPGSISEYMLQTHGIPAIKYVPKWNKYCSRQAALQFPLGGSLDKLVLDHLCQIINNKVKIREEELVAFYKWRTESRRRETGLLVEIAPAVESPAATKSRGDTN